MTERPLEPRKQEEIDFHNRLRSAALKSDGDAHASMTTNYRFYSVDRASREFTETWLRERCPGRKLLDFCCGEGDYSMKAAQFGADVLGIDISDVSVEICRERARKEGHPNAQFEVRDAEETGLPDNSFDLVICAGVLHHVDLPKAYAEIARLLRPGGEVICVEALAHNPVFQAYRKLTPKLRTAFEADHILRVQDVEMAKQYFGKVEKRFFHLAALLAVPFRNLGVFEPILNLLNRVDTRILSWGWLQRHAWIATFTLADPKKSK